MVRDVVLLTVLVLWIPAGVGHAEDLGDPPGDPAGQALDFYQRYLSSLRHARCRFHPSCSEYARRAIAAHGLFDGVARAADRLMRCNASAGRFYARAPNGLLDDPARGGAGGPVAPRLARWLLPAFAVAPPDYGGPRERAARIDETVAFARELAVEGDCTRAETEYRRAAHLAGAADWRLWSSYQIGACYYECGFWADAEDAYLRAGMQAPDEPGRALATHLLAASLFDGGRYRGGEELLPGPGLTPRALALRGLCRMTRGAWEVAAADFDAGAAAAPEPALAARLSRLGDAALEGPDLPGRSPGLAMVMSALLPGSGQIYTGRTHDGLRHLLFNGALVYTLVKLIRDDHYPAAYLVGTIGVPFYVGNIRGAGYGARAYNRDRRLEHVAGAIAAAGEAQP